ncbi:MAG TPA: hypothetical protein VNS19_14145 [Acidimicrobiales bacterium]|nr:hypothetical protein [Acidimicrobiales bacterium]
MELRRPSVRRAGLAAVATLLVVGASACSGGTGLVGTAPAATVNDTEISQSAVTDATEATARFYADSIEQGQDSDGSLAALVDQMKGDSSYSVGTEGAAQVLSDMIVDQVIADELAKHDALPTKQDRSELRSQLEQSVGGAAELKKIDAEYLDQYIERRSLNDAFTAWAASSPEGLADRRQAYYDQNIADRPLCLNAIQVQTEEEAKAAKERVDGGEDFVAVAQDLAPGANIPATGAIACLTVEQAQQAFDLDLSDAEPGDVVGPAAFAQTDGSAPTYLVLRVEQTDGFTFEEAQPLLEALVPAEADPSDGSFDASSALDRLLRKADIWVNSVYGRWSDAQQSVIAPHVPGTTTTSTPVAALTGS